MEKAIRIRSEEGIVHSLLALMKEKNYQEITIEEITDRARLVRRTFYRIFSSKQQVLQSALKEVEEQGRTLFENAVLRTPEDFCRLFFSFVGRHREFFQTLQQNQRLQSLLPDFQQWLTTVQKKGWLFLAEAPDPLLLDCAAAACWSVLCWWAQPGNSLTPQQAGQRLSEVLRKLTAKEEE